ncbi:Tricarboxylate transport protein, partial [Pseudocercospora fuligena]
AVGASASTTRPIALKARETRKLSPLESLLAGGVAGAIEASVTYPTEYLKTRSQLRSASGQTVNALKILQQTISQQGFFGLYTGCSALVAGTAVKAGVRFLAFDSIKNALADDFGRLSTANGILAGMLAGAAESVVAVTPTERIKTALIDDAKGAKRFRSTLHGIIVLVREQGLTGIYRGLVSTTIKQSATSAVRMGTYNAIKSKYVSRYGHSPTGIAETFAMGAASGFMTVYATQPLDTIKTRSQSARGERMSAAIVSIWQDGGLRAFWRGSSMRLGRLLFSGGIVFAAYEQISQLMRLTASGRACGSV